MTLRYFLIGLISPLLFSADSTYDDPFSDITIESPESQAFEWNADWYSYYQENELDQSQLTNLIDFTEQRQIQGLQLNLDFAINDNFRVYSSGFYEAYEDDDAPTESRSETLESFVEYSSAKKIWNVAAGRKKIQWSEGFNWTPANLFQPYFDRPNYDRDDREQLKGWDLLEINRRFADSSWTLVAADKIEHSLDPLLIDRYQYALKYSIASPADISLIIYKVESLEASVALTWSQLLTDTITFKADVSHMKRREFPLSLDNWFFEDEGYLKSVIGFSYAFPGWDLSFEYLYNEHGYEENEWDSLITELDSANLDIVNGTNPANGFEQIGRMLSLMGLGQLRQNYAHFALSNSKVDQLLQYRLSTQSNLDDESYFLRAEFMQNWTSHFSSRLEWQKFSGCSECEFGLVPDTEVLRVSFYYLF
ncbi:hypothetical protein [Pleionea sediminis]|uniref:hypothetical protein n=1 Tax=Pleionea sediminis TaxID=2569479 RepID=UPI0011862783|nr:hypothetical protein [Pleionea sediminis]